MKGSAVHHEGIRYTLEAPDYMELRLIRSGLRGNEYLPLCDWNEAEGFILIHEDGSQDSWEHGSELARYGHTYRLPTEEVAERIIDLLRLLEGVTY